MKDLIQRIDAFSDQCADEDYTDTGDAWDLLNFIRAQLVARGMDREEVGHVLMTVRLKIRSDERSVIAREDRGKLIPRSLIERLERGRRIKRKLQQEMERLK